MLVRWAARPAQVTDPWREINRVLDHTFGVTNGNGGFDQAWSPAVDVVEDAKAYQVSIEIPGVKADDVKIQLDGKQLTISGEKKQESRETNDRFPRYERRFGSFTRSFTLPETVNTEAIEARTEHGVLTLTLPKVEKAQPRAIPVKAA